MRPHREEQGQHLSEVAGADEKRTACAPVGVTMAMGVTWCNASQRSTKFEKLNVVDSRM